MALNTLTDADANLVDHVLTTYCTDDYGLVSFPIDPVTIATRMGVDVTQAHLSKDVKGYARRTGIGTSDNPTITMAVKNVREQRMVSAALLGWLLSEPNPDVDSHYVRTNTGSSFFAMELLMPAAAVRTFWGEGKSVRKIAKIFGVPVRDLHVRLFLLGLQ